ncbi:methionyl-tRNA formyltransferase [Desulfofalx alkaliphila]|uniref:methionyl-tRNA formyltransferase n=1 Tax=Desulfofalx alkaliphila TaxID=105483 RepID=UPI0004E10643|nr:methionyl-tRNA formyltransferase [Desulfofalx alkaliphila]
MRIVYMGTPDFAVPCLEEIIKKGHRLVAVVTQPDRPRGRGRKLQPPPVKVVAEKNNIPVLQPEQIKTAEFYQELEQLNPDLIVVVAYGKILPLRILQIPPLGCINVHASLLPKYRGAAPIHWAVINGEKQTGITTMYMDEGMDTGDVILSEAIEIKPDDTVGDVHDRLALLGAKVLGETIDGILRGHAPRFAQDHDQASYAPMLKREHELIHWSRGAEDINNQVRGMNPWPGTYTTMDGEILKVWRTKVLEKESGSLPGTVVAIEDRCPVVQTGKGCLALLELQLQGAKRLDAASFLRGRPIAVGSVLGRE